MKKIRTIIILFAAVISFYAYGMGKPAKKKPLKAKPVKVKSLKPKKSKTDFVGLPALIYTPETEFGGAVGLVLYHYRDKENKDEKPAVIKAMALYTQRKQIAAQVDVESYFIDNYLKIVGGFKFYRFPSKFFGIGPDSTDRFVEVYTSDDYKLDLSLMGKVAPGLNLGLIGYFVYYEMRQINKFRMLNLSGTRGNDGTLCHGIGVRLSLDTRDNVFYPSRGIYFDISGLLFRKEMASEYSFTKIVTDYRHFFQISGNHVFALQAMVTFCFGSVPFQEMPKIGGRDMMRGYYEGRYRDKNFLALQVEYRFPIYSRLGGALFCGAAQVAPDIREFRFHDTKASGGVGLRFMLDKEQHINFRLDFAIYDFDFEDKETYGVYFMLMEAF